MFENKFESKQGNPEQRNFKDILTINDNGEDLIKSLHLEDLKASKEGAFAGDTIAYGNSSLENFKTKMSYVDNFIEGYESKFGKEYQEYPLIDLGTDGNPYISILAQSLGVKGLISIDIANQISKESLTALKDYPEYLNKDFPVVGLKIDMLEFIKQLPDNSCNISMFSIDSFIIKSDLYAIELTNHIKRVVPNEGIVVSFASLLDVREDEFSHLFDRVNGIFFKKKLTNSNYIN